MERDELDVAGLCWARRIWLGIREERTEEGERERVGGVLKREKDLFYFFPCEREREREREVKLNRVFFKQVKDKCSFNMLTHIPSYRKCLQQILILS